MTNRHWRFCYAGSVLVAEVNKEHPDRPTQSDGTIGDVAHQHEVSDHDPNSHSVVTAWDVTADTWVRNFVEALKASKDKRLKYIIFERAIWSLARDDEGWRHYNRDPHIEHAHISFSANPKYYDSTAPWNIFKSQEEDDMTPEQAAQLDRIEAALKRLMAERRTDHADVNPHELVLSDVLTAVDNSKA